MTRRRNRRSAPPATPVVDKVGTDKAVTLGNCWRENRDRLDAITRQPASGRAGADLDRQAETLVEESFALERHLARTPAGSLAGIAAKLRVVRLLLRDFSHRNSIEMRLLSSALRDLRRLGARAA